MRPLLLNGNLRWTFKSVIAEDSAYWVSDDGEWSGVFYLWSCEHQALAYAAGWRAWAARRSP